MTELQTGQPFIFGPYLTTLLRRGGPVSKLKHATVIGYSGGKQPFVAVYVAVNNSSISIAISLVRNRLFVRGAVTVRPLSRDEMD